LAAAVHGAAEGLWGRRNPGERLAAALELVSIEGPLVGMKFPLPTSGSLVVGRTNKGLNLPDPLVSLEHCTIEWTTDRHYIVDHGTPSGTFLDGKRLGGEAVPLLRGQKLQVGESVFVVQAIPGRGSVLAPVLIAITAVVVVVWAWAAWRTAPDLAPAVPVDGVTVAKDVPVKMLQPPLRFIRHYGEDGATLAVSQITDYDHDGVSEVWLATRKQRTLVVTFGGEGEGYTDDQGNKWRVIGDLPAGCFSVGAIDFPNQQCGIDLYSFENGSYRLVQQEGYVVWMPVQQGYTADAPLTPSPKAPTPFQFAGVDEERLEQFLLARGVEEPIHYLVCENAIPGLAAQVVTETGKVETLDFGCIDDLDTVGNTPIRSFGQYRPSAVALTSAGRAALLADVSLFLSGSSDGAFLTPADREFIDQFGQEPVHRDVNRLMVDAPEGVNSGVARGALGPELHALTGAAGPRAAAPVASAIELVGDGTVVVDPEGCTKLEITTSGWNCVMTRLCMANQTFLTVNEVGCGSPHTLARVPYGQSVYAGADENVEIRVETATRYTPGVVAMLRAKVSWRKPAAGAAAAGGPAAP
jgi:hypothetical protein